MISSCKVAVKNYIEKYAQGIKNANILDIGCGNGEYTSLFCQNGNKLVGLDFKNYIKPEYKKFKFVEGNAENLPFPSGAFDLIISFDVLEHIKDDQKAIKEMYRVLCEKGEILLETPNKERLSYYLLDLLRRKRSYPLKLGKNCIHLREYTEQELKKKFKEGGFKKLKVLPFWLGLRNKWFDKGIIEPPKFLERFCQCWFVRAVK